MLDKIDKALCKYLFENGGVIRNKRYYTGLTLDRFMAYDGKANEIKTRIDDGYVDWDKTEPLKDNCIDVFNSTFEENIHYIYYMEGTLVFKDGISYQCGCLIKDGNYGVADFATNIRLIHGFIKKYIDED